MVCRENLQRGAGVLPHETKALALGAEKRIRFLLRV